ncbi:hypothetical protein CGI95_22945 [Vibrio parahaemolyticus]|nr:hypothetical protein CGI95_22945 [Vibrio parahaemolyticus]
MNLPNLPRYAENTANNKLIMTVGSKISSKTSILPQTYNAALRGEQRNATQLKLLCHKHKS